MVESIKIGNRVFDLRNKTYVMGILNVTPDSFSDGGLFNNIPAALRHVESMMRDGVDIIDIGGESTRPNHVKISDDEEIERVVPFINAIEKRFNIPISIDTYKAKVAKVAIENGADLVNDIWGLKYDEALANVIAESGVAYCLMHNRNDSNSYTNLVEDVLADLRESVAIADKAGISHDRIILDPGVGFGKDTEQNLIITNNMDRLLKLGMPVLLGTSRKSMIGNTLHLPVGERVEGTIATSVMAVMRGVSFVRVHDIKENKRAIDMTRAILDSGRY